MSSSAPDFRPSATIAALAMRAELLRALRNFFYNEQFIEVETPLVAGEIIPELHIEPLQLKDGTFLQASPELHMKRLLAAGASAIFQVTRSFRADERGQLHNPEFTIVEWYRAGDGMLAGIDRLDALMQSLLGTPPSLRTTYAQAFERTLGISPHTASMDDLIATTRREGIAVPEGLSENDHDSWLNLLLAVRVEPELGRDRPEIIYHYPASQASLAKVENSQLGYEVAERFELYYRGIELANGFHELGDAVELRKRFTAVNAARRATGRRALPVPERLLAAMQHGLPDCTGVALGFDRLTMLATGEQTINGVMAFP
ncbi:MAG TPA: EF-P lysine aminoacylase EpmA [Lacipirellulaceae bacterium]|jgi:lysyl-tRNA synthetase class 2|nr:EF-P lysine aminoacylase EpmA [Lacipirellulaceae bacterium]